MPLALFGISVVALRHKRVFQEFYSPSALQTIPATARGLARCLLSAAATCVSVPVYRPVNAVTFV